MDDPTSIAGKVILLRDKGYSQGEIVLELALPIGRVKGILAKANSRSLDSRRIFEIFECCLEMLSILREIRGLKPGAVAGRMRGIEQRDMPKKLGAAIERLSGSS